MALDRLDVAPVRSHDLRPREASLTRRLAAVAAAGAGAALGSPGLRTPGAMAGCLRAHGARIVTPVPRWNPSLRALHDDAQHRSFLALVGKSSVGVGVPPSEANAELLVELLTIPRSGYLIRRLGNVVLVSKRADTKAAGVAATCAGG